MQTSDMYVTTCEIISHIIIISMLYLDVAVQTSDMLPHANTLAGLTNSLPAVQLTSNNIPAVQFTSNNIPTVRLVSVPAWDVYNTEYASYDSEGTFM